jgi:predicted aspartyl protease
VLAEEFREDASFAVFNDPLQFAESETERGVEWATFSVTLHPVPEGKARTTRLSKEEFEKQLIATSSRLPPATDRRVAGGEAAIRYAPGRPILVTVRLNGRVSARLILDTGADRSIINRRSLIAAGVDLARPVARGELRGVGGTAEALLFTIESIEVGQARVQRLLVAAHDIGEAESDGLLGRDFLDRFNISLDPSSGIARLRPK